jgi:hypothetical protein
MTTRQDGESRESDHELGARTLGQSGGSPGLRLSAGQMDCRSRPTRWKTSWRGVLPCSPRTALLIGGGILTVAVALVIVILIQ